MTLTEAQKLEIKSECLDNVCEDMSFPVSERLPLYEIVEIQVQGVMTCKHNTLLTPCTAGLQREAENYLTTLFLETL